MMDNNISSETTKNTTSNSYTSKIKKIFFNNSVTLLFIILCVIGVVLSGQSALFIVKEMVDRVTRNTFLVLSLIIPVLAGMGLNFGIVIGAMAGQIAIIAVTHWQISGFFGFILCLVLSTPLAIIFGYLTGKLLNRTKGQEMIASMILGFFAMGLYQFLFLFLIGTLIPMDNPVLVLIGGIGIKNTVDLTGGLKYSLDNILKFPLMKLAMLVSLALVLYTLVVYYVRVLKTNNKAENSKYMQKIILSILAPIFTLAIMGFYPSLKLIQVPMVTVIFIVALCLFNLFLFKTKIGQDLRTVGQDRHIAEVSGINVDRTRIIAITISTVLAAWGQLIFLQNIGTLSTYGSHEQVGLFAVASLLVGGASVTKATIGQAIIGTTLFHMLFLVSPMAGNRVFGDAQVGEYFRAFVAYGVIAVSLALHSWKKQLELRNRFRL